MTQIEMFPTATSSQRDTRASPFHLPESAEAQKMTDISGRTFFPLFKPSDPLGAFSRMFMGMSLWASTKCYLTWNVKPTPSGRSLFQLAPQTLRTDATGFGSSPEMWATPSAADSVGTTGGGQGKSLRTDVKMWPTPQASDNRDRGCMEDPSIQRRIKIGKQIGLTTAVKETRSSGSLNPQWVEWLMGYPEGWTDLED